MKQHIEGNRYDYTIEYSDDGYFEISTIRKKDSRKSTITNLNTIIGEIIDPVLNTIYIEESHLYIENKETGKKLYEFAVETLSDKDWGSRYLESELDEDMQDEYQI